MVQQELVEEYAEHRTHLIGVAYRLTGSVTDAEDAVQEAWLRLSKVDASQIHQLRGWLTTVVARICLDALRSATHRRERYVGSWLPEPVVTPLSGSVPEDPLDQVVRDEGVRMAAMVVLDRLTPEQRVAFVLHDAFSVPYTEIAATLGCSEPAARQHASRGRRAVADAPPPPRAALDEQRGVLERLLAAFAAGDTDRVVSLLHPDVVLVGDSDGKARTAAHEMAGADKVVRFLVGLYRHYPPHALGEARLVLVNGELGVALPEVPGGDGEWTLSRRVTAFTIRDGRVAAIYDVVNPDKLSHIVF
ncbi:MAG: sigma-70 family RNA polymerase sigma factor [Micromonosporaceae bacterium]